MAKTRRFGTRTYVFHSDYKTRENANIVADNFRRSHFGARVVKERGMYSVWVHKKKWMK